MSIWKCSFNLPTILILKNSRNLITRYTGEQHALLANADVFAEPRLERQIIKLTKSKAG